jgi:hypothetical protein
MLRSHLPPAPANHAANAATGAPVHLPTSAPTSAPTPSPAAGADGAPASPRKVRGASARALLARVGRTLRPNGVSFNALGNVIGGARTLRERAGANSMTDTELRPAPAARVPHEPQLLPGGVNHGGRHARDAATLAVGELLGRAGQRSPAWPLPSIGSATPDDDTAGEALIGMLTSPALLRQEALRLFPHSGGPERAQASQAALEALLTLLNGCTPAAPGATAGPLEAQAMLLLALAASCGGDRFRALDAARVLAAGLDISADPGAAKTAARDTVHAVAADRAAITAKAAPDSPVTSATATAWRTAELLAASGGAGFDALLALAPPPGPPEQQSRRRQSLRIYLEARAVQADPASRSGPARLAMAAAVKLWRETDVDRAGLTRAEKSAHFNWRNGMRDSAPGGDLALSQARLQKALTWLVRAERRGRRAYNWTLNPARFAGLRKTPVAAMQDGTLGAHLDTDARENQRYDAPFARAVEALEQALEQKFAARLASGADDAGMSQLALSIAQLAHWRGQIATGRAPGACRFDAAAASAVLATAERRLRASGRRVAVLTLCRLAAGHRRAIVRQACSPDALRRWARRHGAAADPAFAGALDAAATALASRVMKPENLSIDAVCDYLARYATIVPMGNRLRNLDGAVVGMNNTSLPFLPASPDLRARRSAMALIEINTAGHAHEVAFGKQTLWQSHGGAQHTAGLKALDWFHAGSTNGGNTGGEAGLFAGLRLRFLRQLDENQAGTDAHRAMTAEFFGRLGQAAHAMEARRGPPPADAARRLWDELIVDHYFDAPLSVSWQRHPQQSSKIQLYSITGVSAQLGGDHISGDAAQGRSSGGVGVGASALVGYEVNPTIGLNRSERSGANPRTVVQMGWGARGNARVGAGLSFPGSPGFNLLSAATTFGGYSVMAAARAFERDGRLASDFVYQDIESETLAGYVDGMKANWPVWAAAVGEANLAAQVDETARGFQPNQRPAERWRLRADGARRFDALRAGLSLRQAAAGDAQAGAAIEAECDEIAAAALRLFMNFALWWEAVGTWNIASYALDNSAIGLNWWGQAMPVRSVFADRELSWLGSSTAQMNRHSKAFQAPPA